MSFYRWVERSSGPAGTCLTITIASAGSRSLGISRQTRSLASKGYWESTTCLRGYGRHFQIPVVSGIRGGKMPMPNASPSSPIHSHQESQTGVYLSSFLPISPARHSESDLIPERSRVKAGRTLQGAHLYSYMEPHSDRLRLSRLAPTSHRFPFVPASLPGKACRFRFPAIPEGNGKKDMVRSAQAAVFNTLALSRSCSAFPNRTAGRLVTRTR